MEWYMIALLAASGLTTLLSLAGLVAVILVGHRQTEMNQAMLDMEARRRASPPHDVQLRVPYMERLKAEYAKRGMVWEEPKVTTTDG